MAIETGLQHREARQVARVRAISRPVSREASAERGSRADTLG
jgi:hypothetical protein